MLDILPVTAETRPAVLALEVRPEQRGFVEPVAQCLKEAESCRFFVPAALQLDKQIVGFAMYGEFPNEKLGRWVWLDRLLIDRRWQGRGLGRAAVRELTAHLRSFYNCDDIYLSVIEGNARALALYHSLGFRETGEKYAGREPILRLRGPLTEGETPCES